MASRSLYVFRSSRLLNFSHEGDVYKTPADDLGDMIAYNISIGILALPKAFSDLGLVGSLFFILPYAGINYYTSKTVWQVTRRYNVYSYPDILCLIFGRWGKCFGHLMQSLLQGFLMAVHVMAMRKAVVAIPAPLNMTCGVAWTFVGAAVMFLCCMYRNLKDCWGLAFVCECDRKRPLYISCDRD